MRLFEWGYSVWASWLAPGQLVLQNPWRAGAVSRSVGAKGHASMTSTPWQVRIHPTFMTYYDKNIKYLVAFSMKKTILAFTFAEGLLF